MSKSLSPAAFELMKKQLYIEELIKLYSTQEQFYKVALLRKELEDVKKQLEGEI